MKLINIATLGEGNKVCYDAAGNRYFIPEVMRKSAKAGEYAIVNQKTFTSRTNSEEGHENFGKIEACAPWTREDITFIGDKETAIKTKAASRLLEAEEDAYVAQETALLQKTYNVKDLMA